MIGLFRNQRRAIGFCCLVLAVAAVFSMIEPRFLSHASLTGIARHMAANGLAALGLTFVVIVGRFDLSIAGVAAFAAMSMGALIAAGLPLWLAICGGITLGAVIGAISGIAISHFGRTELDFPFLARLRPDIVKLDNLLLASGRPLDRIIDNIHELGGRILIEGIDSANLRRNASSLAIDLVQAHAPILRPSGIRIRRNTDGGEQLDAAA